MPLTQSLSRLVAERAKYFTDRSGSFVNILYSRNCIEMCLTHPFGRIVIIGLAAPGVAYGSNWLTYLIYNEDYVDWMGEKQPSD